MKAHVDTYQITQLCTAIDLKLHKGKKELKREKKNLEALGPN